MPGRDSKRSSRRARGRLPRSVPSGRPTSGLFMPQGYEPGYDYPLLVWLPDAADAGFDLGRTMTRLSLRNFVAVQPAAAGAEDREEAVWRAIDGTRERASIHDRRIFLVGHGRGGTEAFRVACRHADSFAGVISLGGPFPLEESLFAALDRVRRLPMLFCCRADVMMDAAPHTDRTLRLFHAAGATLAMRIYPGGNDLSRAILGDVNRWLMDEICGPSAALQSQCAP
jgi:phospholipase/carboxylesterase